MKTFKIIYFITTGLLSAMMLLSGSMYFIKYIDVISEFTTLGFPTWIVYPLAIAKILGVISFWFIKNSTIKEWVYAGFFFNFMLAFFAHFMINDGEQMGAFVAIVLLATSYISYKKQKLSNQ